MDYFPYQYRPGQKELVEFIDRTVRDFVGTKEAVTEDVRALCARFPLYE